MSKSNSPAFLLGADPELFMQAPDGKILSAIGKLGQVGIFAEPAGSTAYAGLEAAVKMGEIGADVDRLGAHADLFFLRLLPTARLDEGVLARDLLGATALADLDLVLAAFEDEVVGERLARLLERGGLVLERDLGEDGLGGLGARSLRHELVDLRLIGVMIPIIAIVFGIGIAAVSIVTSHREKLKRSEARHLERMAALEKGIELPPVPDFDASRLRTGALRNGVMFILVGIVLYFALDRVAGDDVALFGLLPVAVGAANLVAWFVESRKKKA